ncbi:MAG: T9SS type A sorting domain-containing protein [Salibacteraceae bacterium]
MKKLLLFALSMGLGTLSFAQTPVGLVSVDSYTKPAGVVITEPDGSGSTELVVNITNNETNGFVYPGGFTTFTYRVTVDGVQIEDPTTGSIDWIILPNPNDLAPGQSQTSILSNTWAPQGEEGTHEICVDLVNAVFAPGSVNPPFVTISDANKELCEDFTFQWPVGINDLVNAEISNIKTNGDLMTVFVKNSGSVTELKLMSITGQVVTAITSTNGGQDFNETFDISSLTSGVYIISVQTENGTSQAQKVFIQ